MFTCCALIGDVAWRTECSNGWSQSDIWPSSASSHNLAYGSIEEQWLESRILPGLYCLHWIPAARFLTQVFVSTAACFTARPSVENVHSRLLMSSLQSITLSDTTTVTSRESTISTFPYRVMLMHWSQYANSSYMQWGTFCCCKFAISRNYNDASAEFRTDCERRPPDTELCRPLTRHARGQLPRRHSRTLRVCRSAAWWSCHGCYRDLKFVS